jgi:hypothetical protein
MINAKLQNLYNIKNDIGTAIVNKGGTITESTPFYSYAGEIDNISTGPSTYDTWIAIDKDNTKYTPYTGINTGITDNTFISTNIANMPFINQTQQIQSTGRAVVVDNNSIYYAGFDLTYLNIGYGGRVFKSDKETFANLGQSARYSNSASPGEGIFALGIDEGNIYAVGRQTIPGAVLKKYDKNLYFLGNGPSLGFMDITALVVDNSFAYVGSSGGTPIRKYHKGNLTQAANSANMVAEVITLREDSDFIYASTFNNTISRYHKSNMVQTHTVNYAGQVYGLFVEGNFVYAGGFTENRVKRYHKSNLVFVDQAPTYNGGIGAISVDDSFVYAGGFGINSGRVVAKYHKSNLSFVGNTSTYDADIYSLAIDNNNIYTVGGAGSQTLDGSPSNFVRAWQKGGNDYTQTNSFGFNRWIKNNTAEGTPIFSNAVFSYVGNVQGPNSVLNASNIAYIHQVTQYNNSQSTSSSLTTDGKYIYFRDSGPGPLQIYSNNLTRIANLSLTTAGGSDTAATVGTDFYFSAHYGGAIGNYISSYRKLIDGTVQTSITNNTTAGLGNWYIERLKMGQYNNGTEIVLAMGQNQADLNDSFVRWFRASNLQQLGQFQSTGAAGGRGGDAITNNGYIIWGMNNSQNAASSKIIRRWLEGGSFIATSPNVGGITHLSLHNNIVYAAVSGSRLWKLWEFNLGLIAEHSNFVSQNSGFIVEGNYITTMRENNLVRYHTSNLTQVTNLNLGFTGQSFIYNNTFGDTNYYVKGFSYAAPNFTAFIRAYKSYDVVNDNIPSYTITSLKEE